MKQKTKHFLKQAVSCALCVTMLVPNITPIAAEASMALEAMPRRVDFSRPQALTLTDLGLATGSNAEPESGGSPAESKPEAEYETATPSNGSARAPEDFYTVEIDEPDGTLVQFSDSGYRTYQIDDNQYTTVFGGYSGLYEDEDGVLWEVDDTLEPDGWLDEKPEDEDEEIQDDAEEITLFNDLFSDDSGAGLIFGTRHPQKINRATTSNALKATASNASGKRRGPAYENRAGSLRVNIPKQITAEEGIQLTVEGNQIELIPQEGDFSRSMAEDNAIRYSDVFPGVDFQYTMVGNVLKEDIFLLERTGRHTFSYQLEIPGLRAVKQGNTIEIRKSGRSEALLCLDAPFMTDADDVRSTALEMELTGKSGNYTVTVTADEAWLNDPERRYPVRIDPASAVPADEFLMMTVAKGQPEKYLGWDGTPTVGDTETEKGICRTLLLFNNQNDQYLREILESATQCLEAKLTLTVLSDNSNGESVIQLQYPIGPWPNMRPSWNDQPSVWAGEDYTSSYSVPKADQPLTYDITKVLNEWIGGTKTQAGFLLRTEIEADEAHAPFKHKAVTFYNRNAGDKGPKIEVTWEGQLPAGPDLANLGVDDTTVQVDPAAAETEIEGRTVSGVVAHGLAQAGAEVFYTVKEADNEGFEQKESTTAEDSIQYVDFEAAGLESEKTMIQKSNWQSDGLEPREADVLEFDTIYQIDAYAVGQPLNEEGEPDEEAEPVTGKTVSSDRFLLYRVQQHDLVKRIAKHYDVNPNVIARDNQLYDGQLTEAGTVIFIRDPKTAEPYTPHRLTPEDEMLVNWLLLGLNPNCALALEPINMSTGNFYMNQTDAELTELDGTFTIERSYNSLDTDYRSLFGMGWITPLEQHLSILGDGRILFKKGDGAGWVFEKDGELYRAPDGYDSILEPMDSIENEEEDTETLLMSDEEDAADAEEAAFEGEDTEDENPETMPHATGWKMTDLDGTIRVFDGIGFLRYTEDRRGHRTTYIYNSDYALKKIRTASGKVFEISMDEKFRITEILLPDGKTLSYEYDEDNHLISITNPSGDERRYEYDEQHRMTAWYDENGVCVTANEYDEEGRVTEQTDANGNTAYLEYQDSLTIMTDNRGNVTEYLLDDQKRNIGIRYEDGSEEIRTYGDDGHLESVTDPNGVETRYTYDERGNLLTQTRGDGTTASYTYDAWNQILTATDYEGNTSQFAYNDEGCLISQTNGAGDTFSYEYDEENRLSAVTDANGGIIRMVYDGAVVTEMTDPEGHTTTCTYDEMNHLLTRTDAEGNTTEHAYNANGWEISRTAADGGVTRYEFSPAGEVLSITDPMGTETTFTYDQMHNILSGEDALGNTLTYAYDGNYNRISETNAKGDTTVYEFDVRNRITGVTDALGNAIQYTLDGNGNIIGVTDRRGNPSETWYHEVLNLPTMVKDELGHETYYQYDGNGNVTKITYPDGTAVQYEYDGAGRMVSTTAQNGLVTEIGYDGNGNIIRITDDETRIYRFAYDGNNRLVKATDPLGGVTQYAYDGAGNQIQVTDANENSTDYQYDAVGRLTQVQDALGGTVTSRYDLNGCTLSATDQNGHTTTWQYDVLGQVLAEVNAAGYVTAVAYDSIGNVTKVIDALKGKTATEVDALSRTIQTTDALGGIYTYQYDENGNLLEIAMPDGDTVNMSYDAANRMTLYRDEASVITRYEYDSMGRITKAQDTIGNVMLYEYDERGKLVKQTDTIGRDAIYEYDVFGRLVSVTGTDLATTAYTYDALDRLTSVTQADGTVTAYEYDPVGNLIKTTEPGEAIYTYTYDAINRLTNEVNPVGAATTFQYDAKGNLTGTVDGEGNTNAYVYDVIDRLTNFTDGRGNDTVYEYDELSRLLSYTTPEGNQNEYRYDALGRMTKEKDPNGLITEHKYDVMGNLIQSISPKGAVTSYTYDKHDELTSETDPAGNVTSYAVDLNRRVTEMTQKNGGKYQYTYDAVHRLTSVTSPLGLKRELTYDVADNVMKDTDNLDRTNTFTYDIMHRMTGSVNAEGGEFTYSYDIRGNQNQLKDALGYTWNYRYDLIDQLTASVDPEGKATEYVYNLVGELKSVTKPGSRTTSYQYDGNYNVTSISDPKGYIYEYAYDKDNRLIQSRNPLAETEKVTYDPGSRVTSITDRMGLTERYSYDPHGNILSRTATDGLVTRFSYDILDNLIKVTMPSNLTASYTYDVMGNVTSATDTMLRTTTYTYDLEGNMTSLTDAMGRKETFTYDVGGRQTSYTSNGGNKIHYDYDRLNDLVDKSYEDARDPENKEGVIYAYDVMGQRVSMMDRSGESKYEYDGLGRITKVTSGSGEVTSYAYDECDQLESITYPDGKKVSYEYDKNDNLTKVTDRTGAETAYLYDAINRITAIYRPNGVSTYNTYNARDQITDMRNVCDDCGWVISEYHYTYDDRGFIAGEDVTESLYGYAWDDKHDGKHENWHDDKYPHGDKHFNKHDKDGIYNFQIIGTERSFEYDDDGKLIQATEKEDRQGTYVYDYEYDDMGNRTFYSKSRNGVVQESAEYTYNLSNQMISARLYDGKHYKDVAYTYDADGNRILQEEVKPDERKVELTYDYTVENRLKAVYDKNDLLAAMAYDGDGNRIFQLNYNLHTDDDWKGNSGNGNGNNKDNSGQGNNGKKSSTGFFSAIADLFADEAEETEVVSETKISKKDKADKSNNGNKDKDKGNDGNDKNNGVGNGKDKDKNNNGNSGNNGNTSTGGNNDNNGNANGNTNNTGGSQNQSGILFPIDGEVSELEAELIGLIKTTGKEKNYELVEYVNDVNREYTEVLMELNINGIMDTAYSYGGQRLTNERFTGWTGYYTYDPRGSVTGVTDSKGMIWQSYRYNANGEITFGKPQYDNVYSYNAESYNPNIQAQYLRARYYSPKTANFLTEDSYLGNITDPLTLNRYNYVKSSPVNYVDPSGNELIVISGLQVEGYKYQFIEAALHDIDELKGDYTNITWIVFEADEIYSLADQKHFSQTAENVGVNLLKIDSKEEFINYINSKSVKSSRLTQQRKEDPIEYVSIFSHGQTPRFTGGKENQISFGYKFNESMNFKESDIALLMDEAFDMTYTKFYSCNAGTADKQGNRFAQTWSNKTGGISTALQNARTNYSFMNSAQDGILRVGFDFPGGTDIAVPDVINGILEKLGYETSDEWKIKKERKGERLKTDDDGYMIGYPDAGSLHYPSKSSVLSDLDIVLGTLEEQRGWVNYEPK